MAESAADPVLVPRRHPTKQYHHGRTPAAWAGSILAGIGFVLGSIAAVIGPNWPLIWVSVGLIVISVIAGGVLHRLGYGQD